MDIGVGSYYVLGDDPRHFHAQIDCSTLHRHEEKERVSPRLTPIKRAEDGTYRLAVPTAKRRYVVEPCPHCQGSMDWDWQSQAACFASGEDMITVGSQEQADFLIEEYCAGCEVKVDCARFALARESGLTGIWGGVYVRPHGGNPKAKQLRATALQDLRAMLVMDVHSDSSAA